VVLLVKVTQVDVKKVTGEKVTQVQEVKSNFNEERPCNYCKYFSITYK